MVSAVKGIKRANRTSSDQSVVPEMSGAGERSTVNSHCRNKVSELLTAVAPVPTTASGLRKSKQKNASALWVTFNCGGRVCTWSSGRRERNGNSV